MSSTPLRAVARRLLLCCPLWLAGSGAAWAGAGVLTTTVTPLSPAVTYSSLASTSPARPALDTYVGYRVSIGNAGGNTINNVRFAGATTVTDAQERALFASIEGGAGCQIGADQISISCDFGQLRSGEAVPSFVVFFKAPVKDTVSPTPDGVAGACASTDCVTFSGVTYYAEGTGGLENSTPQNSTVAWAAPVTLGTFNPTLVKSAVQKSGGKLFTGSGGLSIGTDRFATTVVVPSGAVSTTAEIAESTEAVCSVLAECFSTVITIPGTFSPYLTIIVRVDAAAIPKGTKIESVTVQYEGGDVGLCASPTTPRSDGLPCIAARRAYPTNSKQGASFPVELENDFEWTLINTRNGSYKIF
ncbi:MAG: hypothetical protein QM722_11465 [Piscinibacter sp.]